MSTTLKDIISVEPETVGMPEGYSCEVGRFFCGQQGKSLVLEGTRYLTYWFDGDVKVHLLQFPECSATVEFVIEPYSS